MKECFQKKRFGDESLVLIRRTNEIVQEYMDDGYTLTLRQIYYQLVAHDHFPEDRKWRWTGQKWVRDPNGTKNAQPNYTWLGTIISDARLAGLIDWSAIEDRTRNLQSVSHWDSPESIVQAVADQYRIDKWALDQKYYVEVWVEKDALIGVLERACRDLDVSYFSCRGYTSQSELYGASKRMLKAIKQKRKPHIVHLGDHDPSGKDMTRDIYDRLHLFVGYPVEVNRIALNYDQIKKYNPPPNPAKTTDSRFAKYQEEFGDDSWELDALNPRVITGLIEDAVLKVRNASAWKKALQREEKEREALTATANNWSAVTEFLLGE